MTGVAQLKSYSAPPICEREILRYAACKTPDSQTLSLLNECLLELNQSARYKVSYTLLPVAIEGDICDFGALKVQSANLCKRLDGCKSAVVFVASAGMQMDRLITKYAQIQPSKALLLGAIGTALVESLCDEFCADIAAEYGVFCKERFSPGYGDCPLGVQADILRVTDALKKLGVGLNSSFLLSPSKTVTAFLGLQTAKDGGRYEANKQKCLSCKQEICAFRSEK